LAQRTVGYLSPACAAQSMCTCPGEPVIERPWLHQDKGVLMMLKKI